MQAHGVVLYHRPSCGDCQRARRLLREHGVPIVGDHDVADEAVSEELHRRLGRERERRAGAGVSQPALPREVRVPQVWVADATERYVGGCDDLRRELARTAVGRLGADAHPGHRATWWYI